MVKDAPAGAPARQFALANFLAFAVVVACGLCGLQVSLGAQIAIVLISVLLVGVPHGALDPILLHTVLGVGAECVPPGPMRGITRQRETEIIFKNQKCHVSHDPVDEVFENCTLVRSEH